MKLGGIKKNITYSLFSNILSFLIAAIITLIVPRYIGVKSYGLFQLYTFYGSYIGFFYLFFADGLYLRYGGAYYNQIDKHKMSGQFWAMTIIELAVSIGICVVGVHVVTDQQKLFVIVLTAIAVFLVLPRSLLQFLLQCTNRIKDYSYTVIIERSVYLLFVVACIAIGRKGFAWYILADLIGKMCALILTCYYCREIVFSLPENTKNIVLEAYRNISVGIKLMLSNIAGSLIIGIVRYSIGSHWDVATFGKISLTMAVSNMLMVMINAISLVMYPTLRRTESGRYADIYSLLRTALMTPMFGLLIAYYPAVSVLSAWLPKYRESLVYMAILFPVCVFESKNGMLLVTYYKTLRKENLLLGINACSVILSLLFTYLCVFRLSNLDLTVFSIIVLCGIRATVSELILQTVLGISIKRELLEELIMVVAFIFASWFIGSYKGLVLYLSIYLLYLVRNRSDIEQVLKYLRRK